MYFDNLPGAEHAPERSEAHIHAVYRRLYTIIKAARTSKDVATPIVRTFMGLFGADGAVLWHIFDDGARFVAAEGTLAHMANRGIDMEADNVKAFLKDGKPVCRSRSELSDDALNLVLYANFESVILVPIVFETFPAGSIALTSNRRDYFTQDDAETLYQLMSFVSMLVGNRDRDIREQIESHYAQVGDTCSRITPELHKNTIELIQTFAQFRKYYVSQKYNLMAEYLATAVSQIETMAKTIQGLQALGDVCNTKIENFESIELAMLIQNVVDYNRTQIDETAELKLEIASPLPSVLGDFAYLWQAIHELIQNALRALSRKPGDISSKFIGIRASVLPNRVVIEVSDNGCGVAPCDLPKLFYPYFTTWAPARGMGLTRARLNLIKMHGQLFVKPREEGGMTFKIILPDEEHVPQIEVF